LATPDGPTQPETFPTAAPPPPPQAPPPGATTTAAPSPPPPPEPLQPAPRKGKVSKNTGIAIAAIVVVAIVILALLLTGVIPGLKKAGTSNSTGAGEYAVTFSESGLPSGTTWSVTLAGSMESSTSSTISFSEKNGSYPFTIGTVSGYAAAPASGTAVVNGIAVSEPISFEAGYAVTFSETGLPSGAMWSVTLNAATLSSSTASIVFSEANGMYSYSIPTSDGYAPSPAAGSVTVDGAAVSVPVSFSLIPPGEYDVTFTESGLPSGTMWSVTLASTAQTSDTPTITFTEGNNSYPYIVGSVTGYSSSPSSGNVTVHGAAVSVTVIFSMTTDYSGPQYSVTFEQTGLPTTDLWAAYTAANNLPLLEFGEFSTGATIEYSAPNGSYTWYIETFATTGNGTYYLNTPENGTFNVSGQPVTIALTFEETFPVNFTTTSLPNYQEWNVTINGSVWYGVAPGNVTIALPNGTYQYTAASFGYTAVPTSGSITVHNGSVSRTIVFTMTTTYPAVFTESGLSNGTWVVYLYYPGGAFEATNASGSPITFEVPVGTYAFTSSAVLVDYWAASPASGNITVKSPGVAQLIVFSAIPTYTVTATESGLAPSTPWYLIVNESNGNATAPGTISVNAPAGVNFYDAYASGHNDVTGNITVTTGTNSLQITFTAIPPAPTNYNVSFNETGLPSFAGWEVVVLSQGSDSCPALSCYNFSYAGYSLNLSLPNGNYTWISETDAENFSASPMAGFVSIDGASPANITVSYVNSSADYLVAFIEELYFYDDAGGLPNGTSWSVTIGGQTMSTAGMFLFFLLPNGTTNAYTVTAPTGYVAIQSFGNVTGYFNPYESEFSLFISVSPQVAVAFEPRGPLPGDFSALDGTTFSGFSTVYSLALVRTWSDRT
jgi:hypothetical protein